MASRANYCVLGRVPRGARSDRELASRVTGVSAEHVAVVRRSLLAAAMAVQANFETRWVSSANVLKSLAENLLGVASYLRIHRDRDTVQLVLTEPGKQSALRRAIDDSRALPPVVFQTSDAFFGLARAATNELTVLSPFLDQQGADFLLELFALCSDGVRRSLICRPLHEPECGDAFRRRALEFRRLGVSVYEYALPSLLPSGRETFHARSFWPTHARFTSDRATLWRLLWIDRLSVGLSFVAKRRGNCATYLRPCSRLPDPSLIIKGKLMRLRQHPDRTGTGRHDRARDRKSGAPPKDAFAP